LQNVNPSFILPMKTLLLYKFYLLMIFMIFICLVNKPGDTMRKQKSTFLDVYPSRKVLS